MSFTPDKNLSTKKNDIFSSIHRHLYPGRVERMLEGGIDFIPDRREGYRYWDIDGRELLDLHLNGGTFNLGHKNPELVQTLIENLEHYDIGNHHFSSAPKAELAQALIEATPGDMQYVVFTPSGSEANDVAIKSARYATGRKKIVALDAGYHGRSGLSGAAGDDETAAFFLSDIPQDFIKVPFNDVAAMAAALKNNDVALVMMETIPATNGFPLPENDYLKKVKKLCEEHGTLYLADEVQTGLGRTGHRWAIEAYGVEPDIIITGKGLSGGLYPMAAAIMNRRCGDWLIENGWGHVSTFGGSDLGCKVALKALQMSICEATLTNVTTQSNYIRQGLDALLPRFPFFKGIRQNGLIIGLEFSDSTMGQAMMLALYKNGIWAITAGFDQAVIQFKLGILVDKAYCDAVLERFENACIWLVNSFNELLTGGTIDESDPVIISTKELAQKALTQWNIEGANLKLLKHRENTVFKITTTDKQSFALRVHRSGYHTDAELNSELLWMAALNEAGVQTPVVIPTVSGNNFATTTNENDSISRQCSLLEWIDGDMFDQLGRVERGVQKELEERYFELGKLAAKMHNQGSDWDKPAGFTRHAWDADGLLGAEPLWGKFWQHPAINKPQRKQILKARFVLKELLKQMGETKQNYGLIHADFLPENILVNNGELKLIDFDDCGWGYYLFEMATSLFPQITQPFFDELVAAYAAGYRTERELSDADLEIFPAFLMIRGFTYLGWLQTRADAMKNGDKLAAEIAKGLCDFIPDLLNELSPTQRMGMEVILYFQRIFAKIK
jgi:acetylornithine/succinyldiaminopimelate/putrescine aminotransferase/Ser/Thr protein kinase RdoA (MazF antagonist)